MILNPSNLPSCITPYHVNRKCGEELFAHKECHGGKSATFSTMSRQTLSGNFAAKHHCSQESIVYRNKHNFFLIHLLQFKIYLEFLYSIYVSIIMV